MEIFYEVRFWISTALVVAALVLLLTGRNAGAKLWIGLYMGTITLVSVGYYVFNTLAKHDVLKYGSTIWSATNIGLGVFGIVPEILLLCLVVSLRRNDWLTKPAQSSEVAPGTQGDLSHLRGWQVKPASYPYFISMILGGTVLVWVGTFLLFLGYREREEQLVMFGGALVILGVIASLLASVRGAIYIHRMWRIIQDGHARTTPGKAVGLCFVPLFNLVWAFTVFWGWAKDYAAMRARAGLHEAPTVTEGLFLTTCILLPITWIASFIPYFGLLVAIPQMIVGLMVMAEICRVINYFADLQKGLAITTNTGAVAGTP